MMLFFVKLFLFVILLATGCSTPRIIVINDPLDAKQHNDLGASYENRQEYDLAQREYQRAAELDKEWALPLFNLGNVHARLGQWSQAVSAYKSALVIDPDMTDAKNNLAWALVKNGQPKEAVSLAEQVIDLDGTNPNYWDTLAAVYLANGRIEEADRAAKNGLALTPPNGLKRSLQEKVFPQRGQ